MKTIEKFNLTCPLPFEPKVTIQLAHGGGGILSNQLIDNMFLSVFDNQSSRERHDSAILNIPQNKIAYTTDSFVVHPLFFPGGDIGELAVNGTVNDLAMSGAHPKFLSLSFILEEGLPIETLWKVVQSIKKASLTSNVEIVTGDTKVVDRGKGDGIFINTSGIGIIEHDQSIGPREISAGDKIILSGDIGRHGMAIMAVREGLEFESQIESDCAPLSDLVLGLISNEVRIHCMRDLTRGGLASALNELCGTSKIQFNLIEKNIPVRNDVKAACEILGLDPLYVANEGRFALFVPPGEAEKALKLIKRHPLGSNASIIGSVAEASDPLVVMKTNFGTDRIVDMLSGEQLPRIC